MPAVPPTSSSATTAGRSTPREAAGDRATSTRLTARSTTRSPAAALLPSVSRTRVTRSTSVAATVTTTRSTASRSSRTGNIQLTPRRHMLGVRAGADNLSGAFESFRVLVGARQYQHDELEGRRSRDPLRERHDGRQRPGEAPPVGPAHGHDRRILSDARLQRHGRGSAVAAGRRARHRAFPLRGADVAARHRAVRRPRQLGLVHTRGRPAGA